MKNLLFIDLDDTIFQTKRKKQDGIIPATQSPNVETISYMTEYQKNLMDIFFNSEEVKIIPVTARDFEQYKRTKISKNPRVNSASTFFGGLIIDNNEIDLKWSQHIKASYAKLKISMPKMFELVKSYTDEKIFKIYMLEDYYLVIKNRFKDSPEYLAQNKELENKIREIITEEYFIHFNDNNLSVIPNFLDKKHAVEYFIDKYRPTLTIGAGDSITDLSFMSSCHFKLIPTNSQIDRYKLNL